MLRCAFFVILLLSNISVFAQNKSTYDAESGSITYSEVVNVENKKALELYNLAKEWIAIAYNSANTVIQYDNIDSNTLIINAVINTVIFGKKGEYFHILKIETKDGRYRYTLTVNSYYSSGSGGMKFNDPKMGFKNAIFKDVDQRVNTMLLGLKEKLEKSESADW